MLSLDPFGTQHKSGSMCEWTESHAVESDLALRHWTRCRTS